MDIDENNLYIKGIRVVERQPDSFVLILITDEMFISSLLNDLGYEIKVEFIEENNGNIILNIIYNNGKEQAKYNTNLTVDNYPNLAKLKSHTGAYWSVGHSKPDGSGTFHLPARDLIV